MALAMQLIDGDDRDAISAVLVVGIVTYALVIAVLSAVHSFLILMYSNKVSPLGLLPVVVKVLVIRIWSTLHVAHVTPCGSRTDGSCGQLKRGDIRQVPAPCGVS